MVFPSKILVEIWTPVLQCWESVGFVRRHHCFSCRTVYFRRISSYSHWTRVIATTGYHGAVHSSCVPLPHVPTCPSNFLLCYDMEDDLLQIWPPSLELLTLTAMNQIKIFPSYIIKSQLVRYSSRKHSKAHAKKEKKNPTKSILVESLFTDWCL